MLYAQALPIALGLPARAQFTLSRTTDLTRGR